MTPDRASYSKEGNFKCPQHFCTDCGKTSTNLGPRTLSKVIVLHPLAHLSPRRLQPTVDDGANHTPVGRLSKADCSITKRVPIPNDTSSESSRRYVSIAALFWPRHRQPLAWMLLEFCPCRIYVPGRYLVCHVQIETPLSQKKRFFYQLQYVERKAILRVEGYRSEQPEQSYLVYGKELS